MITIIIPTYNSGDFLVRCLESIKQQRREFYELIIIDNCSSDQTLEITTQFQDIVNLLISEADYGNYDAINKGISLSTGDWIYVLGADDFLFDCDTLLKAHKFLEALADDVLIAYGKVNVIDNNENFLYESGGEWWKLRKLFKSKMSIPHQGVFHRSEAFTKFGKFDSSFKYAGDYDLLMRVLKHHPPCFMDITVAGYRFTGGSSQVKTALKVQKEYRRAQKNNGYPLTFSWLVGYIRTFFRLMIWRMLGNKYAPVIDDFFRVMVGKKPIWKKIYR